jgi:hypothetical protein
MIKAIFFDIDGTLRDFTEQGIRPSTYEALDLARKAGILCFVATGRHLLEIREEGLLGDLRFDGYVLLNGSLCLDGSFSPIYKNPIPPSQVQAMLKLRQDLGFSLIFMEEAAMYVSHITPQLERLQAQIGTAIPPVEPFMERGLEQPVYQMIPYTGDEHLPALSACLPLCDITRWHDGGAYDVTPKGGSKQLGIEKVMEHYGLTREQTAAIGDGYNDIPMIRYAGVGIAMGNGNDQVKAAADFITDPIDRDGLLHGVQYLTGLI